MAPEVVLRKLALLRRLLVDLEPFAGAELPMVEREHYKVERILELLATAGADLLQHLLAERGIIASTYRDVSRQAGATGLIPADLALVLEDAAGMRNVPAHLYGEIDLATVQASIAPAIASFSRLVAHLAPAAGSVESG